jgi:hypothetical protein
MNHKAAVVLVVFALTILAAPFAAADSISLANLQTIDGIIVEESDSAVKLQIDLESFITFNRSSVISVKRTDEADHEKKLSGWRQDRKDSEERDRSRLEFEAEQYAKGFVKHEGQWITQAELERSDDFKRLEDRLDELQNQIRSLTEENRRLQQDLVTARSETRVIQEPVFVERRFFQRRDQQFSSNDHKNHVRVPQHPANEFITPPSDGRRIDLPRHDGRFFFRDDQGMSRNLSKVD